MQRQYHHPLEEGFEERIHTPVGVRSLVEDSHLMKLLRELDKDGFNVDGPLWELNLSTNIGINEIRSTTHSNRIINLIAPVTCATADGHCA